MIEELQEYLGLIEVSRNATQEEMFSTGNDLSRIYSFAKSPSGGVICSPFGAFTDPYEGLATFAHQTSKEVIALAVTASGWGAQFDTEEEAKETRPSENPNRESVKLELIVNVSNEFFSRVSFPESGHDPIVSYSNDGEEAVAGDLLEAIRASLHFHRLSEEDMKKIYEGFRELIDKLEDDNSTE
jgi:hypothetical protein